MNFYFDPLSPGEWAIIPSLAFVYISEMKTFVLELTFIKWSFSITF